MNARIAAIALALGSTGCATIVQGPIQRVAFDTQPRGATVRAQAQTCTTPCSLRLKRNHNVDAEIRMQGYEPETVYIRYELDPWILGNLAFLPLAPLGGVVDIVTGAGFQLYPSFVGIPLRAVGAVEPGAAPERGGTTERGDALEPDRTPAPEASPDRTPRDSGDEWKPIPDGDAR
jgi:hypothetical protein